jgi:hypothetical protein
MTKRQGMWVRELPKAEKAVIAANCERFIADALKPRFLAHIRPTEFNYCIDIFGKWRGSKYSFMQRYRSGHSENLGEEFDMAFARLDYREDSTTRTRFDVMWHRHTGQWLPLHPLATLDEAFRLIEQEELLWPA